MHPTIDYITKNKEWIFSGIGIPAIMGSLWLCRAFLSRLFRGCFQDSRTDLKVSVKSQVKGTHAANQDHQSSDGEIHDVSGIPREWQGISRPRSKYAFAEQRTSSIPLGIQSFSFEYGPEGHANALNLKNKTVRAEIGFTCRIVNPYKALFGANDYALNLLQPMFLSQARNILETHSLSDLRESRGEVASKIAVSLRPQFEELGRYTSSDRTLTQGKTGLEWATGSRHG